MIKKMVNPRNDLSLFNGDVMIVFFCMLYQSGRARPSMPDVGSMFTNPLVNGSTGLTNIRSSTRTRNDINTLLILGVNRVLNKMKRTSLVLRGLKEEWILCFLKILAILSVVPWIKGRWTPEDQSLGSILLLGHFSAFWKALRPWDLL